MGWAHVTDANIVDEQGGPAEGVPCDADLLIELSIEVTDGMPAGTSLRGLVVEIPADLEMVGDEADGTDQHLANPATVQLPEMVEDVGPEPRLAGLGLALKGERPCLERCALCDQLGGLQ